MQLIDRKLYRDVWVIKGRIIALALIIASGVGILFAIQTALSNLISTQEVLLNKMNFADLEVVLLPEDTQNLPNIDEIDGVVQTASRLILPSRILLSNSESLAGLVLYQDTPAPEVNKIRILEGRTFIPGKREVVIDKALSEYHQFRVGDTISVKLGKPIFDYAIVGIAMSPEFLITSANPDYVIAEPGSLGVLWADLGQYREALGFTMVNSLLFRFQKEADPQVLTEQIMQKLNRLNVEKVIPKNESYSYKAVRMDITAFAAYSPAIIIILCLLSVAMGVITFRRFVIEKQREFGILVSLGYRRSKLLRALARIGLTIGLIGALVGLLIGWCVGWAFAEVYANAMRLPVVVHSIEISLVFIGLVIGMVSGCLTLILASFPMLKISPRNLLAVQSAKSTLTPRFTFSKFGVITRYSLRGLMRDKALTASSILAMAGAIAVAISYGLAMSSTFGTVEQSFEQERWSHAVDFQYPLYLDEVDDLLRNLSVKEQEAYYRTSADIRSTDEHGIALIVGLKTPSTMRKIEPALGRTIQNINEAVISADLARDLNLLIGNDLFIEKGTLRNKLTVVGITNDIFLKTVYLSLPVAQSLAQADNKITGMYLNIDPTTAKALTNKSELVARITDKDHLVSHFRREISDMMGMVYITILFSVGVSIIFVATLVYLSIAEKRHEYATLRSMGFTVIKLKNMILTTVSIQIIISLILAVPFSIGLAYFLNERMGKAWFAVTIHPGIMDFALPMVVALVIAPVVGYLGAKTVLNLNIPQLIREKAI